MSMPFAACYTPDCPNFGHNAFESLGGRRRGRYGARKRKGRADQVICHGCGSELTLGAPLRLHLDSEKERLVDSVLFAFLLGAKKRRTVHFTQMYFPKLSDTGYYSTLRNIGARLRGYHAWRNARLLDPRAPVDFGQTARVYTDVLESSLRRHGDVHRHRRVMVIVSVLHLEKSYYILGAHPYFLPLAYGPEGGADEPYIDPRTGRPSVEFARKWDCLDHPVHNTFLHGEKMTTEDLMQDRADVSRIHNGYYIKSAYAELAHFLTVRTLLRHFKRISFCMDAHPSAIQSAMVGLAGDIRSGRAEVVLVQRQYKKHGRAPKVAFDMGKLGSKERAEALRQRWDATEKTVQRIFAKGEDDVTEQKVAEAVKAGKRDPPVPPRVKYPDPVQRAARIFNKAIRGGFGKSGEWGWLRFPSPMGRETECRTLWLTRMPHKTYADAQPHLLYATLQPVDSSMRAARSRVRALDRPLFRAAAGSSFNERYYDPLVLLAELSIYAFVRNYLLLSADQKSIPARQLGLMGVRAGFSSLTDLVMNFRLDTSHAQRMTAWRHR